VAEKIEMLHILLQEAGVTKGDKIVLCAKNSAEWAASFIAIGTFDGVMVPLLNDFLPESIQNLTNHSDATAIFTEPEIWDKMDAAQMPNINIAINIQNFTPIYTKGNTVDAAEFHDKCEKIYHERFPEGLKPEHISYPTGNLDELELINYTSGTTSDPKGVMLSARSISSNVEFAIKHMPNQPGWHILSMLPLGHMYGMAFEFLYPLASGCHIFFLGKTPTPSVLIKALSEVKPYMLVTVPLVVEKIFKGKVMPTLNKPIMKILTAIPGINKIIYNKVRTKLLTTFGGNLERGSLIVGGAAINEKVEKLMKKMNFPYTVGYGMTECGPLICYRNWKTFAMRSCGQKVERVDVRIDSENPMNVVGEIQIKGDNVMMGYYKNPEATKATFTEDGWLKSGDLGVVDNDGNVFIKGRSKNMILSASGQNVYPEEIEDKFNSLPLVMESIVISRGNKIVAIVVPDMDAYKKLEGNTKSVEEILNEYLKQVNSELPAYSKVGLVERHDEPFEKTPKRSIKRFLYS
jgi:long-chain acyl-CoA synthetase